MAVRPASVVQSRGIYHFPFEKSILADDDEQCSALGNSSTSWGAKSQKPVLLLKEMHLSRWANLSGLDLTILVNLHLIIPKTPILARLILLHSRRIPIISIKQHGQIIRQIPWSIFSLIGILIKVK